MCDEYKVQLTCGWVGRVLHVSHNLRQAAGRMGDRISAMQERLIIF